MAAVCPTHSGLPERPLLTPPWTQAEGDVMSELITMLVIIAFLSSPRTETNDVMVQRHAALCLPLLQDLAGTGRPRVGSRVGSDILTIWPFVMQLPISRLGQAAGPETCTPRQTVSMSQTTPQVWD